MPLQRGDIYHVDLAPIQGREQDGKRYVLIVSPNDFNRLGLQIVVPITGGGSFARHRGFAVSLAATGLATDGVVLCNQVRTLDLHARGGTFKERAPDHIVDDVLAHIAPLFE